MIDTGRDRPSQPRVGPSQTPCTYSATEPNVDSSALGMPCRTSVAVPERSTRAKTISMPSDDQPGRSSFAAPEPETNSKEPSCSNSHQPTSPESSPQNRTWLPSGDTTPDPSTTAANGLEVVAFPNDPSSDEKPMPGI